MALCKDHDVERYYPSRSEYYNQPGRADSEWTDACTVTGGTLAGGFCSWTAPVITVDLQDKLACTMAGVAGPLESSFISRVLATVYVHSDTNADIDSGSLAPDLMLLLRGATLGATAVSVHCTDREAIGGDRSYNGAAAATTQVLAAAVPQCARVYDLGDVNGAAHVEFDCPCWIELGTVASNDDLMLDFVCPASITGALASIAIRLVVFISNQLRVVAPEEQAPS